MNEGLMVAAPEERALEGIFERFAERLEARGLNEAQLREVNARIDAANGASGAAEERERLDELTRSVQRIDDEVQARRVGAANRGFVESDTRARITAPNSPYSGMPLEDAEWQRHFLRGLETHGQQQVGWVSERAAELERAVAETAVNGDTLEAHFDAIDKRLREARRGGVGNRSFGLDGALRHMRDMALGREPGQMEFARREFTTTTPDQGPQFLPTLLGTSFWPDILMVSDLINALPSMAMTTKTQEIPHFGANLFTTVRRSAGELADQPTTTVNTYKKTLVAQDLNGYHQMSNNVIADSAPPIMSGFMDGFAEAAAIAIETALISADTNGTAAQNLNNVAYRSAYQAAQNDPVNIGWDGLRARVDSGKRFFAGGTGTGDPISQANIARLRRELGFAGVSPSMFRYLMTAAEYFDTLTLEEFARYDQFGALNALATGTLNALSGTPVIVSEGYPLGLNATGQNVSGGTLGGVLAFQPAYFMVGVRQMPRFTIMPTTGAKVGMGIDIGVHIRLGFAERDELRPGRSSASEVHRIRRP